MKNEFLTTDKEALDGSAVSSQEKIQFPLNERQVEPVSLLRKKVNKPEVVHEEVIKILRQRKRMTLTEE